MNEPIGVIVLAAGQGTRFRQVAGSDRTSYWLTAPDAMARCVQ